MPIRPAIVLLAVGLLLGIFFTPLIKKKPFFPRAGATTLSPESIQEKLKKSEALYQKDPNNLEALVDMGIAYFLQGPDSYGEALNKLSTATAQGALDERIFYYSGIIWENISWFDNARRHYESFLKHNPEDREVQLRLARLLFRMGNWAESIKQYEKFVKANPKDTTALINLGLAFHKKYEAKLSDKSAKNKASPEDEDVGSAISYLERAAKIQPDLPEKIYATLAKLYLTKSDFDKAVSAAELELKTSPQDKEALQTLLTSHEKLNQKEKALDAATRLLEVDSQNRTLKLKVKNLKAQIKK